MSGVLAEDFVELLESLKNDTHAFDLFAILRRIDALNRNNPPLGKTLRPRNDLIRLGQKPSSLFAPSSLANLERDRSGRPAKLSIYGFGLFGPNGPMPLVMTEYIRERAELYGDRGLIEFFDLFHHRLISLFYRAWAQAQPTNCLDRPETDAFSRYIASLLGVHGASGENGVSPHALLFYAGHLSRQVRNPEGLAKILSSYFQANVVIQEYACRWLPIPEEQQTCLGALSGAQLGVDAIVGSRVLDRQHHFSMVLGALSYAHYRAFLPGNDCYRQLITWVQDYIGLEFGWQVTLKLEASEVPACKLGGDQQLGWSTWLAPSGQQDRADLTLFPAG